MAYASDRQLVFHCRLQDAMHDLIHRVGICDLEPAGSLIYRGDVYYSIYRVGFRIEGIAGLKLD
jgi:hypothetical protein